MLPEGNFLNPLEPNCFIYEMGLSSLNVVLNVNEDPCEIEATLPGECK